MSPTGKSTIRKTQLSVDSDMNSRSGAKKEICIIHLTKRTNGSIEMCKKLMTKTNTYDGCSLCENTLLLSDIDICCHGKVRKADVMRA